MSRVPTDSELREDLREARLRPDGDSRSRRIYRALRSITDGGSVYYVLTDTPEQTTDIFRILVDDKFVIGFELERDNAESLPTDVQQYSVDDYRKAVGRGGLSEAELRIALKLARDELGV
jgi:hypothetical protein